MTQALLSHLAAAMAEIEAQGLARHERPMAGPQGAHVRLGDANAINLASNNYLGLADHPRLATAAKAAIDNHGYGMAAVRGICGTQALHHELEHALAIYLGREDAVLFGSCYDANAGLFAALLGEGDAVVADARAHASIRDGIRLSRARCYDYANADAQACEAAVMRARAEGARFVLIATDGVFAMKGQLAPLPDLVALARRLDATLMVDDCHATGFLGSKGRGTPAHFDVAAGVDILTGTLGKALGGAAGGYVAGPRAITAMLRQRARPYVFSNALPPAVAAASLEALRLVEEGDGLRARLFDNASYWRGELAAMGFDLLPGAHPIVPVMLGEARLAQEMATRLLDDGVHVAGFFPPAVPEGRARLRTQMNAALTTRDLNRARAAFQAAGRACGVID